jgi:hypothetical protein
MLPLSIDNGYCQSRSTKVDLENKMKRSTKSSAKKLNAELARIVRGIRGGAAQIAEIGHLDKSYVSRVIAGQKPPSMRFLLAFDAVLTGVKRRVNGALLHRAHPELTSQGDHE